MAAGGVSTAEDAYRKLRLGAIVVQLYTGLVYRGPGVVREILRDLVALLERDGLATVADAVGAGPDGGRRSATLGGCPGSSTKRCSTTVPATSSTARSRSSATASPCASR